MSYKGLIDSSYNNLYQNENERNSFISYSDVVKKRDSLRDMNKKGYGKAWYTHQKYLLMEILTGLKPKRNELRKIHIIYGDDNPKKYEGLLVKKKEKPVIVEYKTNLRKGNYINILSDGSMRLILHNFKTAKTYKEIVEEIPSDLCEVIRKSLLYFPRKCLFGRQYKGGIYPYESHEMYTKIFYRSFISLFPEKKVYDESGKEKEWRLTPCIWRHIWLSDTRNINFNEMDNVELTRICNLMGTSLNMAMRVYKNIEYMKMNVESYKEEDDEGDETEGEVDEN